MVADGQKLLPAPGSARYSLLGVYTFERAKQTLTKLSPENISKHEIIEGTSNKFPYLQVGSGVPSGGRPHVILRSLQKLHGRMVFFCSVVVDCGAALNDFEEDVVEAGGGFKSHWSWGATSLTLAGICKFGLGHCPSALLASASVGGCFCGTLSRLGINMAGKMRASEALGVRRVDARVWLFKTSCSRSILSMNCRCMESSEYADCCSGAIG